MNLKQFIRDLTVLLVGLALAIGGYVAWDRHTYHDTNEAQVSLKKAAKSGQDTVLIFHKTGCADCRKVVTNVNKGIRENQDTLFVVDDTKNSDLYKNYKVVEVPTFIRLHNGKETARYSGTDTKKIEQFLSANETK